MSDLPDFYTLQTKWTVTIWSLFLYLIQIPLVLHITVCLIIGSHVRMSPLLHCTVMSYKGWSLHYGSWHFWFLNETMNSLNCLLCSLFLCEILSVISQFSRHQLGLQQFDSILTLTSHNCSHCGCHSQKGYQGNPHSSPADYRYRSSHDPASLHPLPSLGNLLEWLTELRKAFELQCLFIIKHTTQALLNGEGAQGRV